MSQVASLPGTDTRNCNSNMMQPLRSLFPTSHSFQLLLQKISNHASTQGTLHNLDCIGHSTPAVEFIAEFTDMQYEIVAKYAVDHVLHYVLDYVLSTLFSQKHEIFEVQINVKDLSAKFQHLLWASSPD